jgi:hypothetical protein
MRFGAPSRPELVGGLQQLPDPEPAEPQWSCGTASIRGFQNHVPKEDGREFGRLIPNGLSVRAIRDAIKASHELSRAGQATCPGAKSWRCWPARSGPGGPTMIRNTRGCPSSQAAGLRSMTKTKDRRPVVDGGHGCQLSSYLASNEHIERARHRLPKYRPSGFVATSAA